MAKEKKLLKKEIKRLWQENKELRQWANTHKEKTVGSIVALTKYSDFVIVDIFGKEVTYPEGKEAEIFAKSVCYIDAVNGTIRIWINEAAEDVEKEMADYVPPEV